MSIMDDHQEVNALSGIGSISSFVMENEPVSHESSRNQVYSSLYSFEVVEPLVPTH